MSCNAAVLLAFSAPVLIYGTIIMFDMMLAACVTLAMIALLLFVKTGRFGFVLLFGLATGLGVLAKGPVILIHVLFPWLL
ncbi:MAG: hypothetical protein HC828_20520, partial [Blastochloris sp.]|nr:hypothetical protein [Blastochloris sp.]